VRIIKPPVGGAHSNAAWQERELNTWYEKDRVLYDITQTVDDNPVMISIAQAGYKTANLTNQQPKENPTNFSDTHDGMCQLGPTLTSSPRKWYMLMLRRFIRFMRNGCRILTKNRLPF